MKQFKNLIKIATIAAFTLLGLTVRAATANSTVKLDMQGTKTWSGMCGDLPSGKWGGASASNPHTSVATFSNTSGNGNTSPKGTVTAVAAGWTSISLKLGGNTWTIDVTVTDSKSETIELEYGKTQEMTCEIAGSSTTAAATWSTSTSNPNVVTVTGGGSTDNVFKPSLEAIGLGDAEVKVWNEYMTYTYTVHVKKQSVDGGTKEVLVGKRLSFTDGDWGEWSFSSTPDQNIAKAEKSGTDVVVDGIAAGETTVKLENATKIYTYTIRVKKQSVDGGTKEVFVGNSLSFTDAVWGDSWTCSSANTGIAKATKPESGTDVVVKGVTAGQTTISVENATTVYTYTVKVNAKPEVTKDTVTLQVGDTTDPISDAAWGSGWTVLSDRTSIATVATSGSDAFVVTGKAVGTANVRVTTDDTIYVYPIVVTRKQETVDYLGDTITYSGAEVAWVGTDLVFTFNDLEGGNLNLPTGYKADVLVVGGGAGGVKGKSGGSKYTGNGGNGGRVTAATEVQMPTGVYSIQVGVGGAGVSTGTQDFIAGGAGSASSIGGVTGFETLTAQGGEAGVTRDNTNAGVLVGSGTKDSDGKPSADGESAANGTSAITGTSYTYGKGGSGVKENCASEIDGAAGDEYGEGGGGSANGGASGAGYQGVVIVRLKPNLPVEELTIETYPGRSKTLSFEGNISSVKTQDENIAQVAKDGANNSVTITGVAEGETFVTVVTSDKIYKYTVKVGAGQVINKKVVLAKGGNGTQTTYTQTFDVIEGTLPSTADPAIAGVAWSSDGKTMTVTPVGKGTTQLTVEGLADDIPTTYNFTIEVEEFENSVAPFGESFIAYSGAELQTMENGDLVLAFNETGSFTVPTPYTATMNVLAVGGGGAGGSQPDLGVGAAGGGAGGFTLKEGLTLIGGTYNVAVGAGGTAPTGELAGPVPGANGQSSALTDANNYAYVSAEGGGGGGAPVVNGNNGLNGGSGGGATWFLPAGALQYVVGTAGTSQGGQGWRGSVPSAYGAGGGGGGAGGRGGEREGDTAGILGGLGLESAIGGSTVMYAQGGDGAERAITTLDKDLNGVNPGDGGDGGNGTSGGSGADGVVIVRFSKLSQNTLVPVPTEADILALRHQWADGETFAGLKGGWQNMEFRSASDGRTYKWGDVVKDIYYAGDLESVTCGLDGETKVGIGYYNFTITLKNGFAWVDSGADPDPYGDTESKSFRWSIVENLENVDADVRVEKLVSQMDGPNATVTVNTFSSPELTGKNELNVLFIGTACPNHGLVASTIAKSLNAILEKANVTYYLYASDEMKYSGTRSKGDKFAENAFSLDGNGGKHKSLSAFYARLHEELVGENKKVYDYIVFEIDGSRVAAEYASPYDYEAEVAEALKSYYQNNQVIWIVDNPDSRNDQETRYPAEIGRPSYDGRVQEGKEGWWATWSDGENRYWRPNTYFFNTSQNDNNLAYSGEDASDGGLTAYRGLVGLFDPLHYKADATTFEELATAKAENVTRYNDGRKADFTSTYYANDLVENQATYDNPDEVTAMLSRAIKPKPYNLVVTDKIVEPAKGLTVQAVSLMVCTNGQNGVASTNPDDWHEIVTYTPPTAEGGTGSFSKIKNMKETTGITDAEMTVSANNEVSATLMNIDFPVWTKLDIHVLDDGTFRTSVEDAAYNPETGLMDKNPNDGKARAELTTVEGTPMEVWGEAETQIPWSFDTFKVTGDALNGEIFVGGGDVHEVSAAPGSTVVTYFRGKPGYTLSRVEIDGDEQTFDANTMSVTIQNIDKDHHIHVEYVSYMKGVESSPVINPYDGRGHLINVKLVDDWGLNPDDYEIRYSLNGDADADDYLNAADFRADKDVIRQIKDVIGVGEDGNYLGHEIFYRVFVKPIGYQLPGDEDAFADTGVKGSNFSVITPLPIVIKPADHEVIYVGAEVPNDFDKSVSGLVEGEGLEDLSAAIRVAKVATEYKKGDPKGAYKTWIEGLTDGTLYGNYVVKLEPNALFVEKWPIYLGWEDHDPTTERPRVMQHPYLDPETMDTGVDRVEVDYDGQAHSLEVLVTGPKGDELFETDGEKTYYIPTAPWYTDSTHTDYYLEYYWDEGNGDPTTDSVWSTTNPEFVKAGTYKVWYRVRPKNVGDRKAGDWYLDAQNYNYVVINPIEITVESATAEKWYDKTPLTKPEASIVEGALVTGDTITYNVTGSQQNVGSSANAFTYTIKRTIDNEEVDVTASYTVTQIEGTLTVKPSPIVINGVTQSKDPEKPLAQEVAGVKNVEVFYFGGPTNIEVNVVLPPEEKESADVFTVLYTLTPNDDTSWKTYEEFTDCVNVGEHVVWYRVESHLGSDPDIQNYIPVKNWAKVIIKPREVTVEIDDKTKAVGMDDPEFTSQITTVTPTDKKVWPTDGAGVLPGEEALIAYELTRLPGEDVGAYPIVRKVAEGEEQTYPTEATSVTQGNYKITFVPGTLTIVDAAKIISLWITDHADAGSGYVHLAFKPTMNVSDMTRDFFEGLAGRKGIRVVYGKTEDDLKTATPVEVLLRANWDRDFDKKGWVWITVPVPTGVTAEGQVWKIDIQP